MENGLPLNHLDFNSLVVSSTNSVGDSAMNTRRMLAKSWTSLLLGNDETEDEHYSSSPPTIHHHHLQNTHLHTDPNDLVVLHDFNDHENSIIPSTDINDNSNTVTIQQRLIKKQLECRKLRMLFSPPEMLTEAGDIEESYFRPDPSRIFNMDCLKTLTWNRTDEELLRRGINEFGNDWTAIILKYLPNWDAKELQEKCKQLRISTKKKAGLVEPPIKTKHSESTTKRKKKTKKESESEEEEYEENETDHESVEYVSEEEKPKRKNSKKSSTKTVILKPKKKATTKQTEKPTKKMSTTNTAKNKTTPKKSNRKKVISDDEGESEVSEEEEEFNEGDFVSEDEMSDDQPPKSRGNSRSSRPKRQVQRYCYHENSSGEDEMLDQYID